MTHHDYNEAPWLWQRSRIVGKIGVGPIYHI
jgi:hypothetical protein